MWAVIQYNLTTNITGTRQKYVSSHVGFGLLHLFYDDVETIPLHVHGASHPIKLLAGWTQKGSRIRISNIKLDIIQMNEMDLFWWITIKYFPLNFSQSFLRSPLTSARRPSCVDRTLSVARHK